MGLDARSRATENSQRIDGGGFEAPRVALANRSDEL